MERALWFFERTVAVIMCPFAYCISGGIVFFDRLMDPFSVAVQPKWGTFFRNTWLDGFFGYGPYEGK